MAGEAHYDGRDGTERLSSFLANPKRRHQVGHDNKAKAASAALTRVKRGRARQGSIIGRTGWTITKTFDPSSVETSTFAELGARHPKARQRRRHSRTRDILRGGRDDGEHLSNISHSVQSTEQAEIRSGTSRRSMGQGEHVGEQKMRSSGSGRNMQHVPSTSSGGNEPAQQTGRRAGNFSRGAKGCEVPTC